MMRTTLSLAILMTLLCAPVRAQLPTLQEADAHFQARRWNDAERVYRQILARDSTVNIAWYRLGRISLEGRGDGKHAADHFRAALRHGFMPPIIPRLAIASALAQQGESDRALALLDTIARSGFSNPDVITADTMLRSLRTSPRYDQIVAQLKRNVEPCEHVPESRQLDFWIGTWDVFAPNGGVQQGTNRVEKLLRGCALQENWTGGLGREGKSMNFFDPQRKTWRQVWIADNGSVLDYREGTYRNRAMVFSGVTISPQGDTTQQRLTFHHVSADTVRQVFETSSDRGRTWTPTWTGIYVRRKS